MRALVAHKAIVDAPTDDGITPLHLAAQTCNVPGSIIELLSLGADVNARSSDDWTPLHYAVREFNGVASSIVALMDGGADIGVLGGEGVVGSCGAITPFANGQKGTFDAI